MSRFALEPPVAGGEGRAISSPPTLRMTRLRESLAVLCGGSAAAAGGAAILAVASCLTAVPDLPTLPLTPPSIDNAAVVPPEGVLLEWPTAFSVPVRIVTPGEGFFYSVFLDSVLVEDNMNALAAPDGGEVVVPFSVRQPSTLTCPHEVQFVVANGFVDVGRHTPNYVGGDVASWTYYNEGPGGPQGCPVLDAGSGALPDAALDALPTPPIDEGGVE